MANFKIGNTEFSGEGLSNFGATAISTIQNWGKSNKRNPMLGKNINETSPWSAAAGTAGSFTVDLLDAISMATDDGTIHNPYYRTGLYGLGGNLYGLGGDDILGMGSSFLNIIGQAKANSTLDTDPAEFSASVRSYGDNVGQTAYGATDNTALLNLYDQASPITGGVQARDFRNKTRLQDFTTSLASSFEGFNAGSSAGPWGAAIGGIFGGLASDIGIGIGRRKAKQAAGRANRQIADTNRRIDQYKLAAAENVDYLNDLAREQDYMNTIDYGALGGPLNTHGADFLNGLIYIDEGGTHEENPNTGVPAGVDAQGTPNLVEEGEVIWNDYVFSNRIEVPEDLCKKYKLQEGSTFAEAVRKLTKESEKRPNSPIDKDTNKAILSELEQRQEDIRMDIQAKELAKEQRAAQKAQDTAIMDAAEAGQIPISFPQLGGQASEGFALGGNLFWPGGILWDPERRFYQGQEVEEQVQAEQAAQAAQQAAGAVPASAPKGLYGSAYGSWKQGDYASNWNTFSRNAIVEYAKKQKEAYDKATTKEEKERIKDETINTINLIQTGYKLSYQRGAGSPRAVKDTIIRRHQQNWNDKLQGNSGFTNIAGAVNLPKGHNSGDDAEHGWVDGLWGPYTSIRNAGSSLSSDEDMREIRGIFDSMGLNYDPTLEYGDNGDKLYLLSKRAKPQRDTTVDLSQYYEEPAYEEIEESLPAGAPKPQDNSTEPASTGKTGDSWKKYAPAYGAGVAALHGILGRPDYTNADAIIAAAREMGTPINIPVTTIGDYRKRRPYDERYMVNLANQRRMAGIRAAQNTSAGNRAQQLAMSNLLAQTGQEGLAEIMRQAYLANRQDDADVMAFNRGTNQFNASSINQRNLHQAGLNTQRQAQGLSGIISGRGLRQNIKNVWDQNTGQNLNTFLQGLADLYRDDVAYNQMKGLEKEGYWRGYGQTPYGDIYYTKTEEKSEKKCGGKLNRKKRRF